MSKKQRGGQQPMFQALVPVSLPVGAFGQPQVPTVPPPYRGEKKKPEFGTRVWRILVIASIVTLLYFSVPIIYGFSERETMEWWDFRPYAVHVNLAKPFRTRASGKPVIGGTVTVMVPEGTDITGTLYKYKKTPLLDLYDLTIGDVEMGNVLGKNIKFWGGE